MVYHLYQTEEDALMIIQQALDLKVNFIDAAIGYGIKEERIVKVIETKERKYSSQRKEEEETKQVLWGALIRVKRT